MKYLVRAKSIVNNSKKEVNCDEIIDTETNVLFKECKNYKDIAQVYQAFWDLDQKCERVFILGVIPLIKVKVFPKSPKVVVTGK